MNNFKSENYEIQKRNLESEKEFFNGNKINSKEISSDKVNYATKKKNSNSININLEIKEQLESKLEDNFNPERFVINKHTKRNRSFQINKK